MLLRIDRDANQGFVVAKTTEDKKFASVIMLNCETDFVAKNQEFIDYANKIIDLTISAKPASLEALLALSIDGATVADGVTYLTGKTGEKMQLSHYEFVEAPLTYAYNHFGNRLAAILGLNKTDVDGIEDVAKHVAMQIAAMAPVALDKDGVDAETIAREIEVGKDRSRPR